jgi:class 3 adenylate cyclase/tetratricopeptide (TPR) repeat protein
VIDANEEQALGVTEAVRTFLIADVRGYTRFTLERGDEAAARLAARFAAVTRDTVSAHSGEVVELRGDEALAVFSSARQALRAAVGLVEAFSRETSADPTMPFKVGIGLDAGEAVPVEGGYRGAALNLAARLCSLAGPGEILASEGIIHLARRVEGLAYVERGALELKGFDDPVPVVEVRPAADRAADAAIAPEVESDGTELPIGGYLGSLPANRVVGREPEMGTVLQIVETVMRGTGRLLLLAGEPGVGKTRLAQEVTLVLRDRGFRISAGRCYEPQQAVPYYPFVEALTRLYATAPAGIRRELPARWSELGRLLPALGVPSSDYAGPQDQQRLFWAVTGFIQALARLSPIALLLDDLHWADASSLELLQHLARQTGGDRVLVVGTYRDVEVNRRHPLEAALRDLGREGLIERLEVRRLGREQTRELIGAVMGQEEAISDEFTDLLYQRTEGNAFFVQQVLRAMVEGGDVVRKDGRWDRKAIAEIAVPESVRSVVGQRLSRLAEGTQELLREASVLGQTFSFRDLEVVSGRDEEELERALDEAIGAGMVRETGRDAYAFDHALTQGTLYAELSSRRRRRLHLAAGEAIEALPERARAGRAAELARHFLEGDEVERALTWSMAAGDEAEAVFGHRDAEHHYRTALQLAVEAGGQATEMEAREKLGGVLGHLARYDEALEVYEPVVSFSREQADFDREIRLMASIGWIYFEQQRRDEGIERLDPVLQRWEANPLASGPAASLHVALGNLYWHGGRLEDALLLLDRAAELATAVGDRQLLGMAESRRGTLLEFEGRSDEALAAYGRAISLLDAAGELEMLGRSLTNRSYIFGYRGRKAEAWADLERALEVDRRLGDPAQIGWSLGVLAQTRWVADGDWTQALVHAEEVLRLEPQLRGTRASGWLSTAFWLKLVVEGQMSALRELERLAAVGEQEGDIALWMTAQDRLGEWDVLQAREQEALARYDAVLTEPRLEGQARPMFDVRLANLCVLTGELERADALIAGHKPAPYGFLFPWPSWRAIRARLHAARGDTEKARASFEEALAVARELDIALGVAETAYAYGEFLVQGGENAAAREKFEEALGVFRRMGAWAHVERTERALAQL